MLRRVEFEIINQDRASDRRCDGGSRSGRRKPFSLRLPYRPPRARPSARSASIFPSRTLSISATAWR